ncbi:hypothetical protein [Morganella morganii]|uniref:hypothetical protein n=1 Tax=Morganella morganii TaxID=582 RepID=UPI003CD0DE97
MCIYPQCRATTHSRAGLFCFSLYGHILDSYPGMTGYKIVFGLMALFACCDAFASGILIISIKNRKARADMMAFSH